MAKKKSYTGAGKLAEAAGKMGKKAFPDKNGNSTFGKAVNMGKRSPGGKKRRRK